MEFSTYSQVSALNNFESTKDLENVRKMKLTKLPKYKKEDDNVEENPFLDIPLRTFLDHFVFTWNKIILNLLQPSLYEMSEKQAEYEWWDRLLIIIGRIAKEFWIKERIFYVGVGFIVISFFIYFIFAAS